MINPIILTTVSTILLAHAVSFADSITLIGGDVLRGTIVTESDTSVTIDHGALGRIEVARDQIASIEMTPIAKPVVPVEPIVAKPTAILPAPVPPPPAAPDGSWKFMLSLGMSGSKNDQTSNWDMRAAAEAMRESESDRTTISSEFYYKTSDGVETDNNVLVRGLEEFLFKGSRWEAFVQGTYQNDNFQEWEQRIGGYAGPGYRLIEGEPLTLKLRGGVGASYEFPTSTWTPELLLGEDLVWTLDTRSLLKHGLEIYPDLNQMGEYRFIARVDYEIALTEKNDLKATVGVRDEFDSYLDPDGGTSNDIKIYAGLKYVF